MFVAGQGMSEGLSQTTGAQIIPRVTLRIGEVQLCAQWRNISSPIANGIAAFFVKWSHRSDDSQVELAALYRLRTEAPAGVDRNAWEFDGSFRHSFGKVGVRAIAEYSPKEFEAGQSIYVELGPTLQIAKTTIISLNAGRRERGGAPDYSTFNAGVTRIVGRKLSVDARVYATDHPERGSRYRTRLVVSARVIL